MPMAFNDLNLAVIRWAEARQIIPNSTPEAQFRKMISEIGELADWLGRDIDKTKDAVGDILVCLINMCALLDIDPTECLRIAYDEIKHRRGTLLPNGVFVKEERTDR